MTKKIGFLSFGHWQDIPGSKTLTARDSLIQSIELAEAAEEVGADGAYFRVHHFARQQSAPFPLLAAAASRTTRIEIGTAVIDMRYETPMYMAEEAAQVDLISNGRLQLGLSRGSPEPALRGWETFGKFSHDDETDTDMAHRHSSDFLQAIEGTLVSPSNPKMTGHVGSLAIQPRSPGLSKRIWWGAGTRATAEWAGEQGMNLMSSTLLTEDTGVPFDQLQAEQIEMYKAAWANAEWDWTPRVCVSRSVIPLIDDESRRYFWHRSEEDEDQVGYLDGGLARFGRSYIGEPDQIAKELAEDAAVAAADTLLVTIPNQLGVDFNAKLLESIVKDIKPSLN